MISLLFAIGFWIVVGWAAFGAVFLFTLIWLAVLDWLEAQRDQETYDRMVVLDRIVNAEAPPRLRPFDQDDLLERAWGMPCAPDPRQIA